MRIIGGKFKGRVLYTPKTDTTRPTQAALREAVFNICQSEIENATFLDLFAGSGAMGFEALSRGASHVTLVESNKQALIAIKKNIELLEVQSFVTLLAMDATMRVFSSVKPFDIIYIDPPYDMNIYPILNQISKLLTMSGNLFVEARYEKQKEPEIPFLTLKSARKYGSTALFHYTK
ncbi:MAG TPA: 16S rRNA (guanine(966)-N(2))-methyltransferase RsmD [Chlamydiales bacterium]|nr:16S rRNA (guanine(966)-N(2))-methyltransferase RsmD [Chlamydiales bacterium]